MKYEQAWDGEWIQPKQHGYKISCCDCGLVHILNFRIVDNKVQIQPTRDNRATAAKRRKKFS